MEDHIEAAEIQWHPGFYGAAELELDSNRDDLEFQREYNLSKKPLRLDLLIIKKLSDIKIKNEIGYLFKKYNIIELTDTGKQEGCQWISWLVTWH